MLMKCSLEPEVSPGWWVGERAGRGFLPLPPSSISASATVAQSLNFSYIGQQCKASLERRGKLTLKINVETTAVVCLSELLCALLLVLLLSEGGT